MVASTPAIGGIAPGRDQEGYVIMIVSGGDAESHRDPIEKRRLRKAEAGLSEVCTDADIGARYASGGIEDVSR
jgi:hypothetical protein